MRSPRRSPTGTATSRGRDATPRRTPRGRFCARIDLAARPFADRSAKEASNVVSAISLSVELAPSVMRFPPASLSLLAAGVDRRARIIRASRRARKMRGALVHKNFWLSTAFRSNPQQRCERRPRTRRSRVSCPTRLRSARASDLRTSSPTCVGHYGVELRFRRFVQATFDLRLPSPFLRLRATRRSHVVVASDVNAS